MSDQDRSEELAGAGYKWQLYQDHGIDVRSDAFHASMYAASDAAFMMDALRILRCNLRAVSGDEAEVIRCVACGASSYVMGLYLRDVFAYAFCAPDGEREAFVQGLLAYAKAAFAGSERAQAAFKHENGYAFGKWNRTFDIAPSFSVCEMVRSQPSEESEAGPGQGGETPTDWNAAARIAANAKFDWVA